ncbi:MAG: cupin domain-containing protein [Dehalococcoidia bacterium]|nr:cupin domain-containing protein [Dehalococcoidia bacterium]
MTTTNKTQAKVFEYINDDILAGKGDLVLPGSDELSGVIKRYLEGGENKLHCHPAEDHTFFILQGKAEFRLENDDNIIEVKALEGVFLPKGTNYWFHSSGDQKLIMLRVGTEQGSDRIIDGQLVKSHRTGETAQHAPVKVLPF